MGIFLILINIFSVIAHYSKFTILWYNIKEHKFQIILSVGGLNYMIILGIDPGIAIVGYGIIEYKNNKFKVIDYGAITTP